ncbi:MAG: hypothetical protein ACTSWI_00240, partial [Alphaproteobacteria bacterium]
DLDLGVTGAFGDVTVGFGVHSDAWAAPTFDASLGFTFGGWTLTLNGATTGWAPWLPTASAALAGAFGDFMVDVFVGWEDLGAPPHDRAIAARVRTDLGGMSVFLAAMHGQGDASWGGPGDWKNVNGVHPYTLTPGDSFYAVWGGVSRAWNSEHSTALNVYFSNGITIALSQYARVGVTHTWTPVGGAVTVKGNAWMQTDFGGVAGTVWGASLSASLALIR